jgi:hypothetical protein
MSRGREHRPVTKTRDFPGDPARIRLVRLAFFTLLFLNLVYFAWAHWIDVSRQPPVNDTIAHLPQLKLVDEVPPAQRPQPHTAQKTSMSEPAACLSVGPFADLANSTQAAALLKTRGFDPHQRAEQGPMSEGYWVYVIGLVSQAEVDNALAALERSGIKDARVMPESADGGRRLSLGLYSDHSRAERRAQAVRQAGLNAAITARKVPGSLYWVDVTPPPGVDSVPLQDLIAAGINSRVGVQPCVPAVVPPARAATAVSAAGNDKSAAPVVVAGAR